MNSLLSTLGSDILQNRDQIIRSIEYNIIIQFIIYDLGFIYDPIPVIISGPVQQLVMMVKLY